jgi:penicillin-binding protein 2
MSSPSRRRLDDLSTREQEVSPLRLRLFALVVAVLFTSLVARLWYVQVLQGDTMRDRAESNRRKRVRSVAPRGAIVDAKGRTLVTNSAQFTVFVDASDLPKNKAERQEVLNRLAGILGMTLDKLEAVMKRNKFGPNTPIPVAEGVNHQVLATIEENRLLLPGVDADVEPVRRYPNGATIAHVLGYIGPIDKELEREEVKKLGYQPGDFIGKDGIEKQYDAYLRGDDGGVWYEVDAKGRRQREFARDEPVPGATLKLALDLEVQKTAEKLLAGKKGAVVAVDPRDGRVLAMVSTPSFDPNWFAKRPRDVEEYRKNVAPGLFSLAMKAEMPPGSTYKIVTAAAGLATGEIGPNSYVSCGGGMSFGSGYFKHCHSTHGSVNLETALAASCDVFFYRVGLNVQPDPLAAWAEKFGLGQKSGIDLPWEQEGYIPNKERHRKLAIKMKNPDTGWYPGMTANVAIGQGEVLTTPLQMALVAGAIGNGGTVYEPRVVQEAFSAADGKVVYRVQPKVSHTLGLTPEQIRYIAQGLRSVVAGPRGTSHSANLASIAVAGKSGSAELRGTGGGRGATHAWFVCYAPYDKPTIAMCVFLQSEGQNYHGGADAAPIARTVLAKYFNVPDVVSGAGDGSRAD